MPGERKNERGTTKPHFGKKEESRLRQAREQSTFFPSREHQRFFITKQIKLKNAAKQLTYVRQRGPANTATAAATTATAAATGILAATVTLAATKYEK